MGGEYGHESLHIGIKAVPPDGLQPLQRVFVSIDAAVPVDDHHCDITFIGQYAQQCIIGILVHRCLEFVLKASQHLNIQVNAQWALL